MSYIDDKLAQFKTKLETAITTNGKDGKASIIRSSKLINLIHDAVKKEFIRLNVDPEQIFPHLDKNKPELKVAGFFKQKKQDVCIEPKGINKESKKIIWGPLQSEDVEDMLGEDFTRHILSVNVRSQMSSLGKNYDTLFERTYAEAINLHTRISDMVLGEVFLIPVYAYDDKAAEKKKVEFSKKATNIEKYISFFSIINNRNNKNDELYKYERCALLIVDFKQTPPKLYNTTQELKDDKLISNEFLLAVEPLSFDSFAKDLLESYSSRFNINYLKK